MNILCKQLILIFVCRSFVVLEQWPKAYAVCNVRWYYCNAWGDPSSLRSSGWRM